MMCEVFAEFTGPMVQIVESRRGSDNDDYLSKIARTEIDGHPPEPADIA